MKKQGFGECPDCNVWSDIPEGFKEIRHFIKCPKCLKPMYLVRGVTPNEVALKETAKVEASLMLHGEKL